MPEKRRDNKGRILRQGESQRKDLTYMYRFTDETKKRHCIYASTLQELREKEDQIQYDAMRGISYDSKKITVENLLDMLIEQKTKRIRSSTMENYMGCVRMIKQDAIYTCLVSSFKTSMAKSFAIRLEDRGLGYWRIRAICNILHQAFKIAVEDDIVLKNPFSFNVSEVVGVRGNIRKGLSVSDQASLLEFISGSKVYSKYLDEILIFLHTGVRLGEFCAITVDDVDFTNRRLSISKQLMSGSPNDPHIGQPKTHSSIRTLPLNQEVYNALRRVAEKAKQRKSSPIIDGYGRFLFVSNKGKIKDRHYYDNLFGRIEKAYNKKHKVPIHVTPHLLRHTYCTNMVRAGVDLKSLQYLMGHTNVNLSLNVYADYTFEDVEAACSRIFGNADVPAQDTPNLHQIYTKRA